VGDLTLFKALTGGPFDRLNWQHSEEFDQNIFSKSLMPRGLPGGGGGGGMGCFGIDWYISMIITLLVAFSTLLLAHCFAKGRHA